MRWFDGSLDRAYPGVYVKNRKVLEIREAASKLPLIPAIGLVGGAVGFLLDRRKPLRGFVAGAVAGASLAALVSLIGCSLPEDHDYYSTGRPFYGEQETEAGV